MSAAAPEEDFDWPKVREELDTLARIAAWSGVSLRALLYAYLGQKPLSARDCDRLRALRDELS